MNHLRSSLKYLGDLNDDSRHAGANNQKSDWYKLCSSLFDLCEPLDKTLATLQVQDFMPKGA